MIVTGMSNSDSDSNVQDSGRAIPTACHADGPLLMNFWERRQLDATWEDGTTTPETSTIGNFTSEGIGDAFPVDYVETKTSQGGSTMESVFHDTSHPFALDPAHPARRPGSRSVHQRSRIPETATTKHETKESRGES